MKKPSSIVFFSMSYFCHWERGILNREYFIHKEICKRASVRIATVDMLPYSFRSFLRSLVFRIKLKKRLKVQDDSFLITVFKTRENEFLIIAPIAYFSERLFKKKLSHFLSDTGFNDAWAWSYNPLSLAFLDKFFRTAIFEAVDDWRYHAVYRRFKKLLAKNYRIISKKADYIFSVSSYLNDVFKNEFQALNAYIIPNGIDNGGAEVPKSVFKYSRARVVYLGNIEERIDFNLLKDVAASMPEVDFFCIGKVWPSMRKKVKKTLFLTNLHFVGSLPYSDARKILPYFSSAIIPHKYSLFTQSNDPLKFYDYLSSGLPVVSTVYPDDKILKSFINLATTSETFTKATKDVIKKDTESARISRINLMKNYSWSGRVDSMFERL